MALIPESTIDEILSRVDIVELISSYIPLKRIGRSYKALCPFHHEKTASFIVSSERQIFHCFGCGAGGNSIGFVMQYERLGFLEAVEILAKKVNVIIPKTSSGGEYAAGQGISSQLYKINEFAATFYSCQRDSREGSAALNYLLKRGISKEIINKFRLGYATDSWDALISYLRTKNIPLSLIEKAGLIIAKDGGGYYDRFRNRIIIPIIDVKDRIVAFGARVLDSALPKYVNSPETSIYSKSKNFFGLNFAKDSIRQLDEVIIVEGYFDLITPYQAGVNNIVASCGTALTSEQIRLLKRYTKNVIMIYDSDNAGELATTRSIDLLIEEDSSVKVAYLPQGYDPDSFIRKLGADKFRRLVTEAKDILDYKFCVLKSKYNFESIADKAKVVSHMLLTINKFNNAVIKSSCIKRLAEELKVDEDSLRIELKKLKDAPNYSSPRNSYAQPLSAPASPTERMLVKLILAEQELIEQVKDVISPLDFQDKHLAQIVARLFDLFYEGKKVEPSRLIDYFSDEQISKVICELSASDVPKVTDKDKVLNDCIKRIRLDKCKLRQQEVYAQIKQAEMQKDENQLRELLKEFQSLTKKGVN